MAVLQAVIQPLAFAALNLLKGLLRGSRLDLDLLDVNLTSMKGLKRLERLRSNCFRLDLVSLPVILITGNLEKDILLRANAAGVDECIMNPFELDTLSQIIAQPMPS